MLKSQIFIHLLFYLKNQFESFSARRLAKRLISDGFCQYTEKFIALYQTYREVMY